MPHLDMTTDVLLTMTATPEKDRHGRDIVIDWYTINGYLQDFLQDFADNEVGTMTFNTSSMRYEIRFSPNEYWPKDLKEQLRKASIFLECPDDDGNYLIDGNFMLGCIRSINGEEFYEWRDDTIGNHTSKKFLLKEEYYDVL